MHPPAHEPIETPLVRSQTRQFVALLVICAATAQALGLTLNMKSQFGANDISRWCTVWSLLERGTYAIDDCPWQGKTQDKVKKPDKLAPPGPEAGLLRKLEYGLAARSWKDGEPVERFYSSKPPLLPTLIAGLIYPVRKLSGVRLDRLATEPRLPRLVEKPVEGKPGVVEKVVEVPAEPVQWPAWSFYFKSIILLLNVVPMFVFLIMYARLLDRYAANDWAWFFCLVSAAWGTLLFSFVQTLNNHTVAAWAAFFAIYGLIRIWDEGVRSAWTFAATGFWAAFCACNELPAAVFGLALFAILAARFPRLTLLYFVPAATVPCVAFFVTQFIALGQFKPVYEEFGTKSYTYEGSYWNEPLEMDWFNVHPEPKSVYLFHMTFGHHGVFSLTPIFLFSIAGAVAIVFGRGARLKPVAWLTLVLTAAMVAFYAWNPKARNYGGSTQGLRWLFWLIPSWLVVLPPGVSGGQDRRWLRWLALAALFVSVLSVGYALRTPWSHPWLVDAMEHLGLYRLKR
ncbi:MAG: hypothetical protein P4L84_35415 [Isosphaeraceae bacterium]|nr:hypothetical protein [Isosphaeraceae bacterium]